MPRKKRKTTKRRTRTAKRAKKPTPRKTKTTAKPITIPSKPSVLRTATQIQTRKRQYTPADLLILGLIIFVFFITFIIIIFPLQAPQAQPTPTDQTTATQTSTPTATGNEIGIGKQTGNLHITLYSYQESIEYSYFSPQGIELESEAGEGYKYATFQLGVWNPTRETETINKNNFFLKDDKNNRYSPADYLKQGELETNTLTRGQTYEGVLLFKIPDNSDPRELCHQQTSWKLK